MKIKDLKFTDNFILASLDVVNLYPSIDVHEVTKLICNCIDLHSGFNMKVKITLKQTINLIINNNYFIFNNNIYKQDKGAPMGSPISGLLAEFKLRTLEQIILNKVNSPLLWLRFVDDIFIIWNGDIEQLKEFTSELNQLDENIKFTLEIQSNNGTLPFLDVDLHKSEHGISRSVYRKQMANFSTFPFRSNIPFHYKVAAYRFLINRAFEVCTKRELNNELNFIYNLALKNGYPRKIIKKLIDNKTNPPQKEPKQPGNRSFSIDYIPGFFESLRAILKKVNIRLVAKSPPKLKDLLTKKIDPFPKSFYPGVYEIPLILKEDDLKKYYIGATSRQFRDRLKEHRSDVKYYRQNTALARLHSIKDIEILFDEAKLIHRSYNKISTFILESIEIDLRRPEVCNDTPSFNVGKIWLELLKQQSSLPSSIKNSI